MSTGWSLKKKFRKACSLVVDTMGTQNRVQKKDVKECNDQRKEEMKMIEFEKLKSEQVELARLASQYAKHQLVLQETEKELGKLLGNIAMREPQREMQDCLWIVADTLIRSSTSVQRDNFINATITLSKTIDSFLSTAVHDMANSKSRFLQAIRQLQDTESALLRSSSSALTEPLHREKLQVRQMSFYACMP